MTTPTNRDIDQPRPNPLSPFQCGFNDIGVRCVPGPTTDGLCCQANIESCSNSDNVCQSCPNSSKCSVAGQKSCSSEHTNAYRACIPVKSHWYSRNILALNLAILTGGVLLVCMALPSREHFFVPGTLSRNHSQILENTLISDRCSLCHPSAHPNPESASQEQLCMKCHTSHMPDAIRSSPHDLTADQFISLANLKSSLEGDSDPTLGKRGNETSSTHCAHCHTEHHGAGFDLKTITDSRCQSCHARQFTSFSSNHPEFTHFPLSVPRKIAFDHRAHMEKHYAQKNSQFDCKSCHELDPENPSKIRRTASFENACAQCHQEPLRSSTIDGWAILQLPSLNDADLKAAAGTLSNWPTGALYGYDGRITLPMRLLLSADPTLASAIKQFPDGDLSKTSPRNPSQQAAIREIARGLRQLFRETSAEGHEAWKLRLTNVATQALKRAPNAAEENLIRSMVTGLPPDLFGQIDAVWFAGRNGVAINELNRVPAVLVSAQDSLLDDSKGDKQEDADSLLRGSSTQGLIYKNQVPNGSSNANAAKSPNSTNTQPPTPANSPPQIGIAPPPKNNPKAQAPNSNAPKSWTLGASDEPDLSADELLKLPSSNPSSKSSSSASNSKIPVQGQPAIAGVEQGRAGHSPNGANQNPGSSRGKFTAASVVAEGGWYLDSKLYVVKYMPSGHADPVIAAWIQFAALVDSTRSNFSEIQSWHTPTWNPGSEAVGGCTQCHLLPTQTSQIAANDWRAQQPDAAKQFTKFSHKPHATLAVTADCKHCHQFNTNQPQRYSDVEKSMSSVQNRFVHHQTAQQHFHTEFNKIEKSQCSACHREGGANQGCTQCHNYHIGTAGIDAKLHTFDSAMPTMQVN